MAIQVLGVRIDTYTQVDALAKVRSFFTDGEQHMVTTPNPEMLVDATEDTHFKKILNEADLNICDGRGIQFMTGFAVPRITGVDFMQDVCRVAAEEEKRVYLLGSGDTSVVEACSKKLKMKNEKLKIVGVHPGLGIRNYELGIRYDEEENDAIIDDIIEKAPDMLFVAFGHGKQEKWIHEQLPHLPSVKVAMGVGGAFDFIAGKAKRAPRWMRYIGLEWFYRLLREPWRAKRMWKAVVIFPIKKIIY